MKTPLDPLLEDVLGEVASQDFRAAVLTGTLHEARRRRTARRRNLGLAAGALLLASCGILLWNRGPAPETSPTFSSLPGLVVIHSGPLDPKLIVETRPGAVNIVQSEGATYAVVETGDGQGSFQEIDDDQLLALLTGHPAVLVRRGPGRSELIFLKPEDAQGCRVQ